MMKMMAVQTRRTVHDGKGPFLTRYSAVRALSSDRHTHTSIRLLPLGVCVNALWRLAAIPQRRPSRPGQDPDRAGKGRRWACSLYGMAWKWLASGTGKAWHGSGIVWHVDVR